MESTAASKTKPSQSFRKFHFYLMPLPCANIHYLCPVAYFNISAQNSFIHAQRRFFLCCRPDRSVFPFRIFPLSRPTGLWGRRISKRFGRPSQKSPVDCWRASGGPPSRFQSWCWRFPSRLLDASERLQSMASNALKAVKRKVTLGF